MSIKLYKILVPINSLRRSAKLSEVALAKLVKISRLTIRSISANKGNPTLETISAVATALDRKVQLLAVPDVCRSEFSTVAICQLVSQDGPGSWRIHYMNLVDVFRATLDPRLILLPPKKSYPLKLTALLASIVKTLCNEAQIDCPDWAEKKYNLESPWFVAETESLKPMAIIESPLAFRRNNIFVLDNFLQRV